MPSLNVELALAGAPPSLLAGLVGSERRYGLAAFGDIARHLVERLRCFDIRDDEQAR